MLLAELAVLLNGLPGVFSTPQWGGRAYKVPRGGSGKPKLLAHVTPADGDDGVTVSFKLQPPEAATQVERHVWIAPHSFRTLAPCASSCMKATGFTVSSLTLIPAQSSRAVTKAPGSTGFWARPKARVGPRRATGKKIRDSYRFSNGAVTSCASAVVGKSVTVPNFSSWRQ
jgi:hypothetical protein